ncbi:TraR/DksA family transcriptional regulator [Aeromonas veronii]|uniref:TraR/DksA family transcriptional regulator n=1 Tax=Aeromonas veronii TaxID=654 RepID=A0A3A9IVF5_AERVE|nr:TraR/DksA family transcriptional regulator [Aeromonas veronii]RKJ83780.1 TraR/DksA family transcriptional regulator [Aeromonas veronii]RKJ84395.1 TraR/DksA family transcriptional regulator [Aeromonas veronii]RKJ89953.1 TraR/DksA family transcriptional regulator [Aeromonas veronii]RKJ92181.1 TraR/DksA family transcriptional regulator [Aeromonas veronii]
MDDIDRATAHAARMLDAQLARQLGKSQGQGDSAHHCEECGAPIPEARRQAIPGVRLCAPCKGRQELRPHSKSRI